VHWHNLYAAETAIAAAHDHGAKFVLDLHENYPYNMWSAERDLGLVDDNHNLNHWFRYESRAIHAADHVVVTIDEMKQRLVGMHHVDPDKVSVVHNTEPEGELADVEPSADLERRFGDRLVIFYAGSCSTHRGLDTIIRALASVREQLPPVALVVVGGGPALAEWQQLAADLGVSDLIAWEGAKSFADTQRYYHVADVGVVPHHKYGQTDNTVPHKLYQNMMMRIPTLVSSCHSLQRIVHDSGAGLVFDAGDPAAAGAALARLADPELRRELGDRGRAAVLDPPFSWAHSEATLAAVYERLLSA
jgi:glycosyltransferase involved in cell wall biosynthesis